MDQGIEIRNLKVDIGGRDIDVSGVTFSNASVHDAGCFFSILTIDFF